MITASVMKGLRKFLCQRHSKTLSGVCVCVCVCRRGGDMGKRDNVLKVARCLGLFILIEIFGNSTF